MSLHKRSFYDHQAHTDLQERDQRWMIHDDLFVRMYVALRGRSDFVGRDWLVMSWNSHDAQHNVNDGWKERRRRERRTR